MDIYFERDGITFVWDEVKAESNPQKHGITFPQATEVFFDPLFKVIDASQNEEEREAVIGLDKNWNVLYVVHIMREDDSVRIISARKATRTERDYYET